jgi:hypothetical protein
MYSLFEKEVVALRADKLLMRLETFPWCRVYNKSLGLTGEKVHSWIVEQLN